MGKIKNFLKKTGKWVGGGMTAVGGAMIGAGKLMDSVRTVSEKDEKGRKNFLETLGAIIAIAGVGIAVYSIVDGEIDSRNYKKRRYADADYEAVTQQAKAEREVAVIRAKAEAEAMIIKAKAEVKLRDDGDDEYSDTEAVEERPQTPWIQWFKSKFKMPTALPPFLAKIMPGVPKGYEEPMNFHLMSILGAMCFSKVRAKYLDGELHAPNLQVVVEGVWGSGKAKFEQAFRTLFKDQIEQSKSKIDLLDDPKNRLPWIVSTIGIGTTSSRFFDILSSNQGCHLYIFNSEVRALHEDIKKNNGLTFDVLRKAFENGDVCRIKKIKDGKGNGIYPVYLNYTITGTPHDIMTTFKKELEGGTLSRIVWSSIPEPGREIPTLVLPEGKDLEDLRWQIDEWREQYAFKTIPGEGDEAVEEFVIDLDYVNKALKAWLDEQYVKSEEEGNPARQNLRARAAAIAFQYAIGLHMVYGNPGPKEWAKRQQVTDHTLYSANYLMERFLHKFGADQNRQREESRNMEMVDAEPEGGQPVLITDISTLYDLHQKKDKEGNNLYGWGKLSKLSGLPKTSLRREIEEYEKKLKAEQ